MARNYSTRSFFRHAPMALLERYFHSQGLFGGLPFSTFRPNRHEPLLEAWGTLGDDARSTIEADFCEIFELSSEKGVAAILDAANQQLAEGPEDAVDTELAAGDEPSARSFRLKLSALTSHFERAMVTFLDHPQLWRVALHFYRVDALISWRKRTGFPQGEPIVDPAAILRLESAIGEYFHESEARGRHCKVETLRRGDLDYFFAYPEDYAQRTLEWVKGSFIARRHNPAFEVIFVFGHKEGTLDINARGGPKTIDALQQIFARAVLGTENLEPQMVAAASYNLNPLRRRDFSFAIPPGSCIGSVRLRKLRLTSRVNRREQITVEANDKHNLLAVHDLLARIEASVPSQAFDVTLAEISAHLVGKRKSERIVTFRLTLPTSCSLRYDDEGLKLRAMLAASGLEPREPYRQGGPATPSPPAASPDDPPMTNAPSREVQEA